MRRTSLATILLFVAGFGIGYFARSATGRLPRKNTHAADLAAIEKLHRADIEATLTQDPSALINLWSDDCVKLGVPGPAVVGKKAIQEVYGKFRAAYPDFKVLKYAPEIQDIKVADGWAIETTYGESTYKMSANDNPVTVQGKAMRVLKRQNGGSWKFALVGLK